MNSRERIRAILARQQPDRCGFWLGAPAPETWTRLHAYFGTQSEEDLRVKLGDDIRWHPPRTYTHPGGRNMFHIPDKMAHGSAGPFADAETVGALDAYEWPNLEYCDFSDTLKQLDTDGDYYRCSGHWSNVITTTIALFGMEHYMIKLHTHPEVVHAVTDRVQCFFEAVNTRFFRSAGDRMDGYFFGSDLGTQRSLLVGPKQFDAFILPWFTSAVALGHAHGYQTVFHSCGAIHKIIGRLIDAGLDCLHPLQALAIDMDADTLAADFSGKIAFMGGIDTQQLLVQGSPAQIKDDVRRVKNRLGPYLIISPSHEVMLPNIPPENIAAMAEAAHK